MTAKNIAAEALETAQELRQIHEVSEKKNPPVNLSPSDRLPLSHTYICQPTIPPYPCAGGLVSESKRGTDATDISQLITK